MEGRVYRRIPHDPHAFVIVELLLKLFQRVWPEVSGARLNGIVYPLRNCAPGIVSTFSGGKIAGSSFPRGMS